MKATWIAILAVIVAACDQKPITVVEKKLPRIAPDGEAYLVRPHSVSSDTEIRGFAPGTRVRIIEKRSGMTLVAVDELQFEVPDSHLTDRFDDAGAIRASDEQVNPPTAGEVSHKPDSDAQAETRAPERKELRKEEDLRRERIAALRGFITAAKDELENLKTALRKSVDAGTSLKSVENEQRRSQINALNMSISAWNVELQTELKAAAEEKE